MAEWKDIAPFIEGMAGLSDIGFCACKTDGTLLYASGTIAVLFGRGSEDVSHLKKISDISPDLVSILDDVARDGKVSGRELFIAGMPGARKVLV
jgi:hypothetical protein